MYYWLWLRTKAGEPYLYRGLVLPGIIPDRVFDLLTDQFADSMGLCDECPLASHCHVIESGVERGRKFCTVLFHDTVRPSWQPQDAA